MVNPETLLFASLNLADMNKVVAAKEILEIPESKWLFDSYRNTHLLPVRTLAGVGTRADLENSAINLEGQSYEWSKECPEVIKDYFEEHIFSWIDPNVRIVILKTSAKTSNAVHIDCLPCELEDFSLKLRYVIQGRTDSLYYLTDVGCLFLPQTDKPFLMDGSWAHGMKNMEPFEKITICLGSPWRGSKKYPEFDQIILKNNFKRSDGWEKYFIRN
ncbi:MAG: hypothetical protein A2622_14115 [Bdellovibrionales bacterium RIFCSPHIGHO2_01_FULL_40_29]|nr:MAG: hypothetical protein A2622_14115 [Bdellovibrionales bacterium RIFCSPHIGHO2_01_FULL_40_29]OFZ33656.1 MAG: hypothetical protein A3D17_11725 [Bdellovibrionales bacterium RIFCSPHIGHO2_02_FULL_40_15]